MVLKIHGHPQTMCTQQVILAAKEKNIPYEVIVVDWLTKKEQKSQNYMEKQPFGLMPYVDDDGTIIFESRAIARYLATKYASQGTPLIPSNSDFKTLAMFEQAASIEAFNFDPLASEIVSERIIKPMRGFTTNEERAQQLEESFKSKLSGYDKILSKTKYLAGDDISLADLFHLPYGTMLTKGGVDIMENGSFPNVTRWWKDLTGRPTWQSVQNNA